MSKPVRHRPESQKQKDAFEDFIRFGATLSPKTVGKVAEKCRVSERTIERWYSWYNWRQRAIQRELAIRPKIEERTNNEVADARAQALIEVDEVLVMTRHGLRNAAVMKDKRLVGLDITPTTARDWNMMTGSMEKLQRLKLLLMGEPEQSGELKLTGIQAIWDRFLKKTDESS